jgi:hypothetical protein
MASHPRDLGNVKQFTETYPWGFTGSFNVPLDKRVFNAAILGGVKFKCSYAGPGEIAWQRVLICGWTAESVLGVIKVLSEGIQYPHSSLRTSREHNACTQPRSVGVEVLRCAGVVEAMNGAMDGTV